MNLEDLEARYERFCKSRHEIIDPLTRTLPRGQDERN